MDGISYAVLFNSLPNDFGAFFDGLAPALRTAVNGVPKWPGRHLFSEYP